MEIALREGRLALRAPGERDVPLYPASGTRFFTLSGELPRLEFPGDRRDATTPVEVTRGGAVERFSRVGAAAGD